MCEEDYWSYAKDSGFNVVKVKTGQMLANTISSLDNKGFDVFLWDNWSWDYSPYLNSHCNKNTYQAEYTYHDVDYYIPQTLQGKYDWFYRGDSGMIQTSFQNMKTQRIQNILSFDGYWD